MCAVYTRALEAVPSGAMYALYASFLTESLEPRLALAEGGGVPRAGLAGTAGPAGTKQKEKGSSRSGAEAPAPATGMALEAAVEVVARLGSQLLAVMQGAHEAGVAGQELYITWTAWALRLEQPKVCGGAVGRRD